MQLHKAPLSIRISIWFFLVASIAGFASANAWAQSTYRCGPVPAVKAALDQLPQRTPAQTEWQYHQQRVAALQALLRQYPDNVYVEREYIWAIIHTASEKDKMIAEYKARHEQNPDSAAVDYLYGSILVGIDSPLAIKLQNAALEKDPRFTNPHLELADIYNSPVFLNREQRIAHVKAFIDACPDNVGGYEWLRGIDDKEFLRPYTAKLRAEVESRSDPDAVSAYRTLWSIEFKAHPASEYDALRRQVGQDLDRLRHLNLRDRRQWYEALEDGYKLVNDQKQADWAEEQSLTRFPQPYILPGMAKWWKDHKWPGDDAPPATKHAFYSDLLAQSGQWLKERPNIVNFWSYRLNALRNLDDAPAAEVETAVEQMLKVAASDAGPQGPGSFWYRFAAEVLSKKHLEPERVVECAQKGLAQWEIESKEPPYDLYATKEGREEIAFNNAYYRLDLLGFQIDGYLQLKQPEKAQVQLEQMDQRLQDSKSLVGDNQERKQTYGARLANYLGLRARMAELQGHKLDAMAFYENALLTRLGAQQKPPTGGKDELAENAHQLWNSLGGTEEGWQVWYERPANELANQTTLTWQDAHDRLPTFELADLGGKAWNLTSLKGKVTFLNFWASW